MRPLSKAPIPQLLPERRNMAAHCSGCVFTAVSVHLDGLNAEDKFRVWVTILGHTPLPFPSFLIKHINSWLHIGCRIWLFRSMNLYIFPPACLSILVFLIMCTCISSLYQGHKLPRAWPKWQQYINYNNDSSTLNQHIRMIFILKIQLWYNRNTFIFKMYLN